MHDLFWEVYCKCSDEGFDEFWSDRLATKKNLLLIAGLGFDPRMHLSYQKILQLGGTGCRDCIVVPLDTGSDNRDLKNMVQTNLEKLCECASGYKSGSADVSIVEVPTPHEPRDAIHKLTKPSLLRKYTDVIIDISSFPRRSFCAIIGSFIAKIRDGKIPSINLHVVVSDNPEIDQFISSEIAQDPEPLQGFSTAIHAHFLRGLPTVWMPILGKGKEHHLRMIEGYIKPDVICPVLPFPSSDLRRCDDLIEEYHSYLFDSLGVDPRNIILASEDNSFNLYRSIVDSALQYTRTFEILGGCRIILSPLSSKLLTVGALLAAVQLKWNNTNISIVHVNTLKYKMETVGDLSLLVNKSKLTNLWLLGDCYDL